MSVESLEKIDKDTIIDIMTYEWCFCRVHFCLCSEVQFVILPLSYKNRLEMTSQFQWEGLARLGLSFLGQWAWVLFWRVLLITPSSQGYGFSSSHVWMWDLDYKESWVLKNWCFWTVTFRRLFRVSWTARRSNQSILKEISPGCSLEGLTLNLKLQYFGHLMQRVDSLEKTDAGRDWGQEEKGKTEDEMVGWHHQLNGHEFD